jgi:hypothetical protein
VSDTSRRAGAAGRARCREHGRRELPTTDPDTFSRQLERVRRYWIDALRAGADERAKLSLQEGTKTE